MNKTLIFRKIGGIISEITEQYQYLAENPENINPLELELFIANSSFLAEHLSILKKLDGNVTPDQVVRREEPVAKLESPEEEDATPVNDIITEVPEDEPVAAERFSEEITPQEEPATGNWFQPVASEPEELFTTITPVEETRPYTVPESPVQPPVEEDVPLQNHHETVEFQSPEAEEVIPAEEPVQFRQPEPVKPLTEGRAPTLNEILSASRKAEPAVPIFNQQENRDLRSLIKLNDKLMFVRDLFSGYSLAYNEAIEVVDRFDTFESADRFLTQNYAAKNRWAEKQASVDQFYEVLRKRFN